MRELSVYVTGIPAFVQDFRRAVAVNALLPSAVEIAGKSVSVPAHFPYLRLPVEHIPDADAYPIRQKWDTTGAPGVFTSVVQETVLKFLRFHEVELPSSESPAELEDIPLNDSRVPIFEQQAGGPPPDNTSVRWLAPMETFTAAAEIDPQYVVKDPGDTVAAYIRFPHGRISTATATPFKLSAVNAATGQPQGQLDQAVAQLMVCKMSVPDEAFEVTCRDYKTNGAASFNVSFKAGVPDPWMLFACTSLEDALQLPLGEDPFGVDAHFSLVYRLTNAGKAEDIALPKSPEGPKPMGSGKCMPPRLLGGATGGV